LPKRQELEFLALWLKSVSTVQNSTSPHHYLLFLISN
jgi:hypothetical protein